MVAAIFGLLTRCPFVFGAGRTPLEIRPDMPIKSVGGPYELLWDVDGDLIAGKKGLLVGVDPGWVQVKDTFRPVIEAPEVRP